jgi:adenine-specific DNA-methyltransferase
MAYTNKHSRKELIMICKERGIKGCTNKKKDELLSLLNINTVSEITSPTISEGTKKKEKLQRLNYIGSKYQLLEWINNIIQEETHIDSFKDITIADLFAGTGIVSYHFRKSGATVISNDAELFSSIIARAFTVSTYNDRCKKIIKEFNESLDDTSIAAGYITKNYSPYNECERKFFTVDNAKRIDHIRQKIEELEDKISYEDYTFILASLLVSADAISNVPAVYGCYLKKFKEKALKQFKLIPVHDQEELPAVNSKTLHSDVLNDSLLDEVNADIVYLDPPYNERQYSKNYFPLNMIAKSSSINPSLKGKTGIPDDCFISPFCKKNVEESFEKLFKNLKTKWIFLSYNSESLVTKNRMCELMGKYGEVTVRERDYKRFKSFEYNEDKHIKEYLFCLKVKRS